MTFSAPIPFAEQYYSSKTVAVFATEFVGVGPFKTYHEHEYDAFRIHVTEFETPDNSRISRIQCGGTVRLSLSNVSKLTTGLSYDAPDTSISLPLNPSSLRKVAEELVRVADRLDAKNSNNDSEETS